MINVIIDDGVWIEDGHGEIVSWLKEEWEDDPEVVLSIVNAVSLAYVEGPAYLRRRLGLPTYTR